MLWDEKTQVTKDFYLSGFVYVFVVLETKSKTIWEEPAGCGFL